MAKKAAPKAAEPRNTPAPAAKPAPKAAAARPKPANKGEVYAALAEKAGVGKKEIAGVFAALGELIGRELGKKGPGPVRHPRPAQAQGRPQARDEGEAGEEPVHRGGDHDQGQARQERRPGRSR